ncbi:MAG: PilZ domain-containing protein [Gammaproteobacteria bacterium]|nr:PilZ domain-containing protein [Gammaproteobacteria bacterium]
MPTNKERRHFSRVEFDCEATIHFSNQQLSVEVIDLCINGAMIRVTETKGLSLGQSVLLKLKLADDYQIEMEVEVIHQEEKQFGVKCTQTDLDSMSHLRKIIELNTGDPSLLQRELSALLEK